jgi:DNA-binding transcriptional ArsR family regulator
MKGLNQDAADEYASWFRCLADGTRVRILSVVAATDHPMTVGEVVEEIGKSQSTVSRHLQILAEDGFVFLEPDGVRTLIRVNETCMTALPEAAAAIMRRTSAKI